MDFRDDKGAPSDSGQGRGGRDHRPAVTSLGGVGGIPGPVQDGQIRGFAIAADGQLTEIERLDFGFDPVELAFGLDGQTLYVPDFSGNTLTVFALDPAGELKPRQTVSSQGLNPGFQGVTVQPQR